MNNKKILKIEGIRYFQKTIKNNKKYAISNTGGDVLLKILDIINRNTFKGMGANLALSKWCKC